MANNSFTVTERVANLVFEIQKLPCFNIIERQLYLELIAELESRICQLERQLETYDSNLEDFTSFQNKRL